MTDAEFLLLLKGKAMTDTPFKALLMVEPPKKRRYNDKKHR